MFKTNARRLGARRNNCAARFRRSIRKLARFEHLEDRRVLATIAWDGGGDGVTWHDPLNWDSDAVPGEFDDAVIDVPGSLAGIEIELGEEAKVQSVDSDESLDIRGSLEFFEASRVRDIELHAGGAVEKLVGDNDLVIDGLATFRGGQVAGSGTITVGPSGRLVILNPTDFDIKSVELFGEADIRNGLAGDGAFEIHPGATVNLFSPSGFLSAGFTGSQLVTNNGTIVQQGFGGGFTGFGSDARLVNAGSIDIQGEGMEILGGGVSSTDIEVPVNSTLRFANNTFEFGAGTRVFGDGILELAGSTATYDFSNSMLALTGTLNIEGGNITIGNPLPPDLFVQQIRSANIFFATDQVFDSTRVEFSQVGGAGKLTFLGNTLLQATTFSNSGGVTIAPDSFVGIGGSSSVFFNSETENFGTIGVGSNRISVGGSLRNRSSGVVLIDDPTKSNREGIGGGGLLVNEGIIVKSGEAESRIPFSLQIDNTGTLRVDGGTLSFNDPNQTHSGRIEVFGDGIVEANLTLEDSGTILTGDGSIQGNVNNSGTVQPGNSATGNGLGTLTVTGNYSQNAAGALELEVAGLTPGSEHDQLQVSGDASFEGSLDLIVQNGFEPSDGAELSAITYAAASGAFSAVNVQGVPKSAEVELNANEARVTFGASVGGVQPSFSGTAEPGSTVLLTSDQDGPLGTTVADAETGEWQILIEQTLSNEIHTITASDPNNPEAEPQFDGFADVTGGESVAGSEDVSLRSGSLKFAPFGIDLDGVLEEDDIILDIENGALTFEVMESKPRGEVGSVKRKFDGSLEFGQNSVTLNGDFAESELLAGALPFTITRFAYELGVEDGALTNGLTAFGRFRNPDLKDEAEAAERAAVLALQALTDDEDPPTDEEVVEVLSAWLVQPEDPDDCAGQIECLLNQPARVENARKVFKPYLRLFEAIQVFGIDQGVPSSGPVAEFMANFERIQNEIQTNQIDGSADFLIRDINDTRDYSKIKDLVAFIAEVEFLGFESGDFDLSDLNDDVFTQRIDGLIEDGLSERNLRHFDEVFQVDSDIALLLDRTIDGYSGGELTQRVLDELIAAANAADDSSIAVTALLIAASRGHGLTVNDFDFVVIQDAPPFERIADTPAEDGEVFILVGDLPREDGNIAIQDVGAFLENPTGDIGRIQSGEDEFSFRVAFTGGELTALNLPTLNLGYKDKFGERIETAAILSFDADVENGETNVDVAAVMDFKSDSEDFDLDAQVIIDAAGDDGGLTFNEDGTSRLSFRAFAEASLEPKPNADIRDFLHFKFLGAQVGFGLDVTFSEAGAQFDLLSIVDAKIDSFELALGGTRTSDGSLPDDALLVITGAKIGNNPAVQLNLVDENLPMLAFGQLSAGMPAISENLGATVRNFGFNNDWSIAEIPGQPFGFDFGIADGGGDDDGAEGEDTNLAAELGIPPDILQIQTLSFRAGEDFFTSNPLDFSLLVSGELAIFDFGSTTIQGGVIDVGTWVETGNFIDAFRFEPVDGAAGITMEIDVSLGSGVSLTGSVGFGVFEYEETLAGGTTQISTTWFLSIAGGMKFSGWEINAEVFVTEAGLVAAEAGFAANIPLGSSGLEIKSLEGRAIRNPPELVSPDKPTDLLSDDNDFSRFIDPDPDFLLKAARETAELNSQNGGNDVNARLFFAFSIGIGLAADPLNTLLIDTTIGAIIQPEGVSPEDEFQLQILGLGAATLFPDQQSKKIELGRAGLLVDVHKPQGAPKTTPLETIVTFAFEVDPDTPDSPFPAELRVGGQFEAVDDEVRITLEGEVIVDSVVDVNLDAGGILVFSGGEGFYGVVGADLTIDAGSALNLDGELFVMMNNTGSIQHIPLDVADAVLPERILELDNAKDNDPNDDLEIKDGFDLFAGADMDILGFIHLRGRLGITVLQDEWTANLEVQGSLFGDSPTDGVVTVGLSGDITVDTSGGESRLRRLAIGGDLSVVLVDDFLEAHLIADLLIENGRFQSLSGGTSTDPDKKSFILGFEFNAHANINEHGCLTATLGDGGPIDIPLFPGACSVVGDVPPTRMEVGNVSQTEFNGGTPTFQVPITFVDKNSFAFPTGTEQELILEYWTMSRPDRDTATPDEDYEVVERRPFAIPLIEGAEILDTGISIYSLPDGAFLPVTVFGDALVETDETFSVFVNIRQLDDDAPIGRVDDGFGTITILNDDFVPEPPEDAVVFFDFDIEQRDEPDGPVTAIVPESGPDASRPELTFDLSAVSDVTHTHDEVGYLEEGGLPTDFGLGRAAAAFTWDKLAEVPEGDRFENENPIRGLSSPPNKFIDEELDGIPALGGDPDLGSEGVPQQQFFEFTIAVPELIENEDGSKTGINFAGIDFWNVAEFATGVNPGDWQVTYSIDNHEHVLASGEIFQGTVFQNGREKFSFPLRQTAKLNPGRDVTFRISGPRTQLFGLDGTVQDVLWSIDNLALFGSEYTIPAPTVNPLPEFEDPTDPKEHFDPVIEKLPEEEPDDALKPNIDPDNIQVKPPIKPTVPPKVLGAPKFFKSGGLEYGSVVYFDANSNGLLDEGEPQVTTDAAGRGEVFVDDSFDTNGNGRIDFSEGVLRSIGGEDLGTGLVQELEFTAPFGSNSVTPLTTLATTLADEAGMPADEAAQATIANLYLRTNVIASDTRLWIDSLFLEAASGDAQAGESYSVLIGLSNTVSTFAVFLSNNSITATEAGRAAFLSIARRIAGDGSTLDLANAAELAAALQETADVLQSNVPTNQISAVAQVVAQANLALTQLEEPVGRERVESMKQVQAAVRTQVAVGVEALKLGQLSSTQLEQQFKAGSIRSTASAIELDDLFPVSIAIRDVTKSEPSDGTVQFEFLVRLSEPSTRAVSIDYQTIGRSAQSETGDYEEAQGTLVFQPGERDKFVSVTVNADEVDEAGEIFLVQLTNPVRTLLADDLAVGTILMPVDADLLPSEIALKPEVVAAGNPYDLALRLPNVVSATIDWGDGSQADANLQSTDDGIVIAGSKRFPAEGDYDVVVTMETANGQTVTARQTVKNVASSVTVDPNDPGKHILTLAGTPGRDHLLLQWNVHSEMLTAWLNGERVGRYAGDEISQIFVSTGDRSDLIYTSPHLPIPMQIFSGRGNDIIFTGAGNDSIDAGPGHDNVVTRDGDDIVLAGTGNDRVLLGRGNDTGLGDSGHDRIDGGDGDDTLLGEAGRDLLIGGNGRDRIEGNEGHDRLYGGNDNDSLFGGSGHDHIFAGAGDDYVHGEQGNDRVFGNAGRDWLYGGYGADFINGGSGHDQIFGGDGFDTLLGASGNDRILGGNGNDSILAGDGNDRAFGNAGDDILYGHAGDDYLNGGGGFDLLFGGSGNDELVNGNNGGSSGEGEQLSGESGTTVAEVYQFDINGDGIASPIDALYVINALNQSDHGLSDTGLDVNGDSVVSPIDALSVINYLNRSSSAASQVSSLPNVEVVESQALLATIPLELQSLSEKERVRYQEQLDELMAVIAES